MGKYLKKFKTQAAYEAAQSSLILPNVSLIVETNGVAYNPYVPPYDGFCKLILNNGETVELEGSGELISTMTNPYKSVCVSVEIGTLCTSIGEQAFYNCSGLTNMDIPDSVTSIGTGAFNNCSGLTSCTIGSGVTTISNGAFSGCRSLTSCTIGSGVTTIGGGAFYQCFSLTSIEIPDSVTSIGDGAFYDCTSLTSIDIPSGVTSIGIQTFNNCSGLTRLNSDVDGVFNIPSGVTSIGSSAFTNCYSLTSIDIPSGVTSIGDYAFRNCSGLTNITSNATTAPTIQSNTFQSVKTGGTLTVPSGSSGYDVWMGRGYYYLGLYEWEKVEQ